MAKDDQQSAEEQEEARKEAQEGEYEHQPRDPVIAEGDYLGDLESGATSSGQGITPHTAPNADAFSTLNNPYMHPEDQNMEMQPVVVGPPGYASPDPATNAGKLLPLEDHALNAETLPEEASQAAISEDYGQDVQDLTVPAAGQTAPITPEASQAGMSGEVAEADYEEMTKADLQTLADNRGVEVASSWTKAEIIDALEENDNQQSSEE